MFMFLESCVCVYTCVMFMMGSLGCGLQCLSDFCSCTVCNAPPEALVDRRESVTLSFCSLSGPMVFVLDASLMRHGSTGFAVLDAKLSGIVGL